MFFGKIVQERGAEEEVKFHHRFIASVIQGCCLLFGCDCGGSLQA